MEGSVFERHTEKSEMKSRQRKRKHTPSPMHHHLCADKGIALVMTLVVSLAGLAIATGIIYFLIQSIAMSAAGKRYATASEAADGAVEVMKDAVNLVILGEAVSCR
jgi:hypothetical protein